MQIKDAHAAEAVKRDIATPPHLQWQVGYFARTRVIMAHADKPTASTTSTSIIADLGEMGKKRAEAMATMQAELFKEFQEISQYWTGRAKAEADLASELISKLTAARSVPETAKAYQEWASQRMQMVLEDGQRLFADSFRLTETTAQLFSDGGAGKGT